MELSHQTYNNISELCIQSYHDQEIRSEVTIFFKRLLSSRNIDKYNRKLYFDLMIKHRTLFHPAMIETLIY